jgi:hypothetical protein
MVGRPDSSCRIGLNPYHTTGRTEAEFFPGLAPIRLNGFPNGKPVYLLLFLSSTFAKGSLVDLASRWQAQFGARVRSSPRPNSFVDPPPYPSPRRARGMLLHVRLRRHVHWAGYRRIPCPDRRMNGSFPAGERL